MQLAEGSCTSSCGLAFCRNVALAVVLPRVMSRTCHCFVVIGVVHARSETQRTPSGGMVELKRCRPDLELPQPKLNRVHDEDGYRTVPDLAPK
jgi:hypothetical protein